MLSGIEHGSSLSSTDLLSRMTEMRTQMFAKADSNGDGALDEAEFEGLVSSSPKAGLFEQSGQSTSDAFAKLDSDGDGLITTSEAEAARPPVQAFTPDLMSFFIGLQEAEGGEHSELKPSVSPNASEEDDPVSTLIDALFGEDDEADEQKEAA